MMRFLALLAAATALAGSPAFAADQLKSGPAPDWVVPQSIPRQSTKAADAPIAILLNDNQIRFDGSKTTDFTEVAIKIQSPDGLSAGNINFPWQPSTDTITVNKLHIIRDGKVIDVLKGGQTFTIARRETNLDAATLDGTLTASIQPEGLQVGDVIDLAVTDEHFDPVMMGHVESVFGLWGSLPVEAAHASLGWSDSTKLATRELLMPAPTRSRRDGFTVVDFSGKAIDPPILPNDAPDRFRLGRGGEATDFSSWSDLAALMKPLFEAAAQVPASGPLRDELETIRKTGKTPKERAELALQLVENRVRYVALLMGTGGYVPATAESSWSRRFGDCKAKSALLVALLRELGINAEPVLVSTAGGDALPERLPMVGYFNHMIVRAHIGGKDYWLDGTRTGDGDLDRIDVPDYEWGLPLVTGAKLVPIVPGPLAQPQIDTAIDIDASAGVFVPAPFNAVQTFRGDGAIAINSIYSKLSSAQLDQVLRGYWRDKYDYVDIKSVNWAFDGKSGQGKLTMSGSAKIDWKDGWFYVPGSTIAYKPDFTRADGPFHDAPFALSFPDWEVSHVEVKLPKDFSAADQKLPQPLNENLAGVHYERTAKLSGSELSVMTSERTMQTELPYKEALAAEPRLRTLYDDDVYLRVPARYQPSHADLAGLVARQPGSASEFVRRGNIYLDGGKLDEAIADFTEAHRLDPRNEWAMADRGIAQVWKHEFDKAAEDFAAAAAIAPDNAALLRGRALMAELKGDFDEAVADYSKSLAKDPDSIFAKVHRASSLLGQGKADEALKDLDDVLKSDASNSVALAARATAYRSLGQNDKALADIDAVVKQGRPAPELRLLRANIFRSMGKPDLVIREAELLMQENPDSDYALVAAGKIFSAAGKRDKALDAINRALAIHAYAYIYLNRSLVREPKDYAARFSDTEEALKLEPTNAEALAMKASLFTLQKKYSEAVAAYDAALAGSEGDKLDIRRGRAIALYKSGRITEAEKAFAEIKAQSKLAMDLNNLCWDEATSNILLNAAVEECRQAVKLAPNDPTYNDSLGMALLRLGKAEESLAVYSDAINKGRLAASYMGRAFAYLRKGDEARAKADRAEALERDPDIESRFAGYGLEFPDHAEMTK
jgi:tetratricopeptide (TPR) repeat protein